MEKNVRLRVLYVMELFMERTDENHGITMQEILQWLNQNDLTGERKSIYEDIRALRTYGLNIDYNKEEKTYRLLDRTMEIAELKLLVDAVHASKFITKNKTKEMIEHIMEYSSAYQRSQLKREVFTEKPKSLSGERFYSMDAIHEAVLKNKQVSFQYLSWNIDKKLELKQGGTPYILSPWLMIWADENYYLVAYDEKLNKFKHFRVDKIRNVTILEEKRMGQALFKELDSINYSTCHFGMYSGEKRRVRIEFHKNLIGVVLDRFGTDIGIINQKEEYFTVNLEVVVSHEFFAWIFAFGDQAQILSEDVAEKMKEHLQKTLSAYCEKDNTMII